MTNLVNDVKEKLEISWKTMDILEKTIEVLCGEKHPDEAKAECAKVSDSVMRDMDTLKGNMLRILKDVEALRTMVTGNEVSDGTCCHG